MVERGLGWCRTRLRGRGRLVWTRLKGGVGWCGTRFRGRGRLVWD
jgi:hypothetical protein